MKQKTLRQSLTLSGNGLHTGLPASIVVSPAPEGHGLVFYVRNGGNIVEIPALLDYVDDCVRATSLSKDGVKIHTVEHLLSACYGLGITNARIECDGCEIPILDGSAKLDDVNDATGLSLESDDYDSIAGHLNMLLEHIPVSGETVTDADGVTYEVVEVDKNRIDRVRLTLPNLSDETAAERSMPADTEE